MASWRSITTPRIGIDCFQRQVGELIRRSISPNALWSDRNRGDLWPSREYILPFEGGNVTACQIVSRVTNCRDISFLRMRLDVVVTRVVG